MLPPTSLLKTCNHTLIIYCNNTFLYAAPANDSFLACSSGLTTFIFIPIFLAQREYCVIVRLLPHITIHPTNDFINFWEQGTSSSHRSKREPLTAITLTVLLGLGATGAGSGIASLVSTRQRYGELARVIDSDVTKLKDGLKDLTDSLASLSEVVLQNRRGLDLLFLQQGDLARPSKKSVACTQKKQDWLEIAFKKQKMVLKDENQNVKRTRLVIKTGSLPLRGSPLYCLALQDH